MNAIAVESAALGEWFHDHAATEALLRNAGFRPVRNPAPSVYLRHLDARFDDAAVHSAKGIPAERVTA